MVLVGLCVTLKALLSSHFYLLSGSSQFSVIRVQPHLSYMPYYTLCQQKIVDYAEVGEEDGVLHFTVLQIIGHKGCVLPVYNWHSYARLHTSAAVELIFCVFWDITWR